MYKLNDFKKCGVAWPFSLPNLNELDDLEKKYFEFQDQALRKFGIKISLKPNLLSIFFYKLSIHQTIVEKVKSIIGENIYIWSSAFFAKAPGEGKIVSHHQDNPYWQLTTDKVVTAWIALTKSNKISGALEVVPGSSKLGIINKLDVENPRKAYLDGLKTTASHDLLSYNQNLKSFIKQNPPEIIELEKGQFSLHHVNTVHGSGVNNSDKHRVGFAVRYISSDTKHFKEKHDTALHVCGIKNDYYKDELVPQKDFSDSAIKQHLESMKSTVAFGGKKY